MRLKLRHISGFLVLGLLIILLKTWKKERESYQETDIQVVIIAAAATTTTTTHNVENYTNKSHGNTVQNETHILSYHSNIDVRGQWQQKQINQFCNQYGLTNVTNTLNINQPLKNEFYRHIIVDDESRSLYCFMPKVGCTTARTVLLVAKGKVPKTVLQYWKKKPSLEVYLEKGIQKSSFVSHLFTEKSRISRIKNYGKYVIIRHPLQRLLSAFNDKLSGPLLHVFQSYNYFEHLKHQILKELKPNEYNHWNRNITTNRRVEYDMFITWIIRQNLEYVNEHFAPQYYNSQPCRVRYNFYGNFDHFEEDFTKILTKFGINGSSFLPLLITPRHLKTVSQRIDVVYSTLSKDLKHLLYQKFKIEFDFYHYLYPTEISITNRLLDL